MSTIASSRGSLATSAGCTRSRSRVLQLRVDDAEAPRLSFHVTVDTVSLPTDSAISLAVSVDLPPRNSSVSQQSTMVAALSL